jgi:hypothetical protein
MYIWCQVVLDPTSTYAALDLTANSEPYTQIVPGYPSAKIEALFWVNGHVWPKACRKYRITTTERIHVHLLVCHRSLPPEK